MLRVVIGLATCALLVGCGEQAPVPRPVPAPAVEDVAPVRGAVPRSSRAASYRIDARLDVQSHRIEATQQLTWTNPGSRPVDQLAFQLYMNAFKNQETVFMRESGGRHRGARAAAGGWGWITVQSIAIAGVEASGRARFGEDETVLLVPLERPIAPGETAIIDMAFTVQLPEVFARTGYKGAFHMVGQWFPKIARRVGAPSGERWHAEPFHLNSEFFADFGTYDVSLTVPDTHVVAATGVLTAVEDHGDGSRTHTYRAEDVHDFAWMADPFMQTIAGTAKTELGDVEVQVYFRPAQRAFAERHLAAGIGAIEEFSARLVPYPWPIMRIITPPPAAADGAGGMEYPTLVTTAGDSALARRGIRLPEYVTIHEVGHNWMQGILASNEMDEAWLDEGVNDYLDGVVMAALYGPRANVLDWMGLDADIFELRAAGQDTGQIPAPIATRSYEFPDFASYADASYGKTALVLRTLENIVGSERFAAALRSYAERHAFGHPTGRDFFDALEASLGEDIDWFVGPAFGRVGAVRYDVHSLRCRRERERALGYFGTGSSLEEVTEDQAPLADSHVCELIVANLGTVPAPTDIEVVFADGHRERHRWNHRSLEQPWVRLELRGDSPVTAVHVDPERRVLINETPLAATLRTHAESGPARRAAARAQFWTQTAMQVLGL